MSNIIHNGKQEPKLLEIWFDPIIRLKFGIFDNGEIKLSPRHQEEWMPIFYTDSIAKAFARRLVRQTKQVRIS